MDKIRNQIKRIRKGKKGKVKKSERRGSEWTRGNGGRGASVPHGARFMLKLLYIDLNLNYLN